MRRRNLFSVGLAFGGLAAAASIGGCAKVHASPTAAPSPASPTTVLLASIPFQGNGNYPGTMQQLMDEFIAQNFTAKHPGVVVKTQAGSGANGTNTGSQALTVAALAGQTTPDTLCGCCNDLPTYMAAHMLMPLDALLKQNNVDLSNFSPGHI
jgi:ABC-type glycerol-3-phosphate transport system substrate-binding protein